MTGKSLQCSCLVGVRFGLNSGFQEKEVRQSDTNCIFHVMKSLCSQEKVHVKAML